MNGYQRDELKDTIVNYMKSQGANSVGVSFTDTGCTVSMRRDGGMGKLTSFATMQWLSQFLNTEEINIEDQSHVGGCDSCDWGSYDEASLVCYNIKPIMSEE